MAVALQAPEGVLIPVFFLEHDHGLQRLHQIALPRDAEFAGEVAADAGDDV